MIQQVLQLLQSSEMTASQVFDNRFFKIVSPEKVFVVVVKNGGATFGWAFQGKGEDGEEVLKKYGIDSNECNLRFFHALACEQDWIEAKEQIERCYREYLDWTKDELLARIKALRKAFIQRFTDRLKPLGFRKSSNHWRREVHGRYTFEVYAQKSAYSDQYYVNLSLDPAESQGTFQECFWTRVLFNDNILDWQLTPGEEIDRTLDEMVDQIVRPVLELDLAELGRQTFIQKNCHCGRRVCNDCWVEKNYWEHCGIPEPGISR